MLTITGSCASELFVEGCRAVASAPRRVAPRGLDTTELLGVELCLRNPSARMVDVAPSRVINPAFAVAEALWILSGSDDGWIFDFNERLRRFADDGRLRGAYGPRLRGWSGSVDQLDVARRALSLDRSTRQAVITLFDPGRDFSGHRDVPCTLGHRFYVREGALQMFTTMRSQDAWLGLPYDLFTFTILHELMAGWLDVPLGYYRHTVDSLHLYDQHLDCALGLPETGSGLQMDSLALPWSDFGAVLAQAIAGEGVGRPAWDEFALVMRSYRLWKNHDYDQARAVIEHAAGVVVSALARWYGILDRAGDLTPAPAPALGGPRLAG